MWDFRRGETTTEAILRSEASSKLRLMTLKPENQTKPAQTRTRLKSLNSPAKADPQAAHFIKSLSWFRTATNASIKAILRPHQGSRKGHSTVNHN